VASTLLFVVAVVATPRTEVWAFLSYALLLAMVAARARVPAAFVARRLVVEAPFLLFALMIPFLAGGPIVEIAGLAVSRDGLLAGWNIIAKATLGLTASILLAATTPVADILHGLQRLHAPRVIVAIAHFMVRYGDVISGEMRRMKIARESRGYHARWIWQGRALASSMGSLFLRSYERGERVYLCMIARGYAGGLPEIDDLDAPAAHWIAALSLPLLAAAVAVGAWTTAA
jgi:cobalt/nickel transport system permease protein